MRTTFLVLATLGLLGCSSSPKDATASKAPAPTLSTTPADQSPDPTADPSGEAGASSDPPGAKGPGFGPGAGAVFNGQAIVRDVPGAVATLTSWAAGTRSSVAKGCSEESIDLAVGATFVICTDKPANGPKTGWTKVEVTGKTGNVWSFRYVHWPSVGDEEIAGTGSWTPDGENSALTYTHGQSMEGSAPAEPPPEENPSDETVPPESPAEDNPSPPPADEPLAPEPDEEAPPSPGVGDEDAQPAESE